MVGKYGFYQKLVLRCYTLVIILLFILSVVSFIVDPFGRLILRYDKYSISNVTTLTFSTSILILVYLFEHVPPLPRIICSLSLPVLGMCFYEILWHYGFLVVWGERLFRFWVLYTVAIAVGTVVLHIKYNILRLRAVSVVVILAVVGMCCYYWLRITAAGFYQNLLLYERGLGPNPHIPSHYAMASLGRTIWLLLVRLPVTEENEERSDIIDQPV